jgi:hypothetical protein
MQNGAPGILVLLRVGKQGMGGERCLMRRFVCRVRDHAGYETEKENGDREGVDEFFRKGHHFKLALLTRGKQQSAAAMPGPPICLFARCLQSWSRYFLSSLGGSQPPTKTRPRRQPTYSLTPATQEILITRNVAYIAVRAVQMAIATAPCPTTRSRKSTRRPSSSRSGA